MSNDRQREYTICKERGRHVAASFVLTSHPLMRACKFCGTHYRYETVLVEDNAPELESSA